MTEDIDLKKKIEAILFAAGRTVTQEEMGKLLDLNTPGLVKQYVAELKAEYDSRDSPILLIPEGEGWKLTVKESYLPFVQKINPHTEFSRATMETLSVIAWKQPILQSQVVEIRSNKAYDHIKELVDLGFISKERYGRSYILKPTQKFLDYFDLPDQESAKKLFKDFKDEDLQKKMNQFKKKGADGEEEHQHLGELDVYDSGEEKDVYADRESLSSHAGDAVERIGNLEVFNEPTEEGSTEITKTPEGSEETSDVKEGSDGESAEGEEQPEETATPETEEEKAKRIAQELLEEDAPKEDKPEEDDIPERELHPELEDYLKKEGEEQSEEAEATEAVPEEKPSESASEEQPAEETSDKEPAEEQSEAEPQEESDEESAYEEKRRALEEEDMQKETEKTDEAVSEEGSEEDKQ